MTREQAIAKGAIALRAAYVPAAPPAAPGPYDPERNVARDIVAVLEALGLVEFKDPAQEETDVAALNLLQRYMTEIETGPAHSRETRAGRPTQYGAGCIIDALRTNGFQIVRKPCAS